MAAARGLAGLLCATPTTLVTSLPFFMSRNVGTVSTSSSSRIKSSSASMSTVTNDTSGKAALMSANFGWNLTHGVHHVAPMLTQSRGADATNVRNAAPSTARDGEDSVDAMRFGLLPGGGAPRLRWPPASRTSHPKDPDADVSPASVASGRTTTEATGASHHAALMLEVLTLISGSPLCQIEVSETTLAHTVGGRGAEDSPRRASTLA